MVGPTIIGPEEFAQAGYDYVGFDIQHGYLDDADVALLLRRLEHVPIATAVRLPSTDPAPIGRVLDAGADAVVIAMVESARTGRPPRSPPPGMPRQGCAASGRCAPASAIPTVGAGSPGERVRDGRDRARALRALDEICAVPGLTGVYVGPADLAISDGIQPAEAWTDAGRPRDSDDPCSGRRYSAAGLVAGIHAERKAERPWPTRGFG